MGGGGLGAGAITTGNWVGYEERGRMWDLVMSSGGGKVWGGGEGGKGGGGGGVCCPNFN